MWQIWNKGYAANVKICEAVIGDRLALTEMAQYKTTSIFFLSTTTTTDINTFNELTKKNCRPILPNHNPHQKNVSSKQSYSKNSKLKWWQSRVPMNMVFKEVMVKEKVNATIVRNAPWINMVIVVHIVFASYVDTPVKLAWPRNLATKKSWHETTTWEVSSITSIINLNATNRGSTMVTLI